MDFLLTGLCKTSEFIHSTLLFPTSVLKYYTMITHRT
uniref:Uncharacterized protein n=1 Tax=Anguilla anguilla TaxID=7936 RepID=A0A0E9QU03_ANGAN